MSACKGFLQLEFETVLTGVDQTCQVTRFRRVTPGNRACHPHFPEHPSGHEFHYVDPESPGIGPDIRNIYYTTVVFVELITQSLYALTE